MSTDVYAKFYARIAETIPAERIFRDPLRTLAYGTDASFYRLIPKLVVKVHSERELCVLMGHAHRLGIPVTFRAAGTSLSGQAVTDSVLVVAADGWQDYAILDHGAKIRLQPGIVGAQANRYLAPLGRKIGPDPASINAAMVGGIAANNASGMCCGTSENSYKTVSSIRIVLADGTLLDTGSAQSKRRFARNRARMLKAIADLGQQVRANTPLADRIRHKFKIKNTTGYSLNALVDYTDPFDIITHLMIGSEGTLGFISEIVYDTVVEHPHKASALIVFTDLRGACGAAATLKKNPVSAVELMDRAALRSVAHKPGMPDYLKHLPEPAAALLVETRAETADVLRTQIETISGALDGYTLEMPLEFTDQVDAYTRLWNIRKGLFPAVGAVRQTGTTVIIEDVAFPIHHLADATLELQDLLARYGYDEAIIFGHALEGNLHFVFTQDFGRQSEIQRYSRLMDDVCQMVVQRYDGSLKAEHGTGRNMAPFVEMEWGQDAYQLMERIKSIFDPHRLLNPGVILNDNPQIHLENLKPLPATNPIVDKCIECGFCEPTCPSRNLTLTPRQRITVRREVSRLTREPADGPLTQLVSDYAYQGDATCAVDGLCELSCPVDINTGELTKALRRERLSGSSLQKPVGWIGARFEQTTRLARLSLQGAEALAKGLGPRQMGHLSATARSLSGNRLPLWNPYMPTAVGGPDPHPGRAFDGQPVVYFPSCVSRTMGPAKGDPCNAPLYEATVDLLERGGYRPIFLPDMDRLCCGMPFDSKGFSAQADAKAAELETALLAVSENGRLPVLCDTSPCLHRMRQVMDDRLRLYEPVEFIHDFLLPRLDVQPLNDTVALHVTCSARKMGLEQKFLTVARACASEVVVPEGIDCCGFAGDRGFSHPELNASALKTLRQALGASCSAGYSNSRTCEIGLSQHSGIYYRSIVYLLLQAMAPKSQPRSVI